MNAGAMQGPDEPAQTLSKGWGSRLDPDMSRPERTRHGRSETQPRLGNDGSNGSAAAAIGSGPPAPGTVPSLAARQFGSTCHFVLPRPSLGSPVSRALSDGGMQRHDWNQVHLSSALDASQQLRSRSLSASTTHVGLGNGQHTLLSSFHMPLPPVSALLPDLAKPGGGSLRNAGNNPLYKTELCRSWLASGSCRYAEKCQFAHGHEDLRQAPYHPKSKTKVCQAFLLSGQCPYGSRCRFIHSGSMAICSMPDRQ